MRHQDRELIKVKTDKLEVIIKGSASHPFYDGSEVKEELSSLKIMCSEAFSGRINGEEISDIAVYAEHKLQPLFFEQQSYQVLIVPNGDYKVEFWHDNLRVRESITETGIKNTLMGNINFGNEIGFSDLVIRVEGNDYLKITIEVFPTKISYREDYEAIIQDVTSEVYNLAFDFLKKTYDSYDIEDKQQSSPVEFFTILKKIYGDFISAADMVLRKPHHLLETEHEVLPGHKVKRVDNRSLKWIQKHPETTVRRDDRILVSKALAVKKHVTYDTKENRLTKYMLVNTVKRLEGFKEQYCKLLRDTDQEVINDIDTMIKEIRRRYDFGFLKDVNAVAEGAGLSLVFSMAPGYRDLYRCYLLLHRGLSITGSVFNISIKDLAVLYEYWCFIKLNSLMRKKYDLVTSDIIKTNGNNIFVSLTKGSESRVKYRNPETNESIILSYNPLARDLPTVSQKPDNVLALEKIGAKHNYEYVFDAKYRIDPANKGSDYAKKYKTPGPVEDTINTMHRYRDAIVYKNGVSSYERSMFGAYVLFPYSNGEEFREHQFYQSIKKVNVGGLPFLPSETELVEEFLDELINDNAVDAFDRSPLPLGSKGTIRVDLETPDGMVEMETFDSIFK